MKNEFIQRKVTGMRNRRQITPRGCAGAKRWLSLQEKALQGSDRAIAELCAIDLRLGERGADLVQMVLVEGTNAAVITNREGRDGRNGSRAHRATSGQIEAAFETLADHFGIAGGGGRQKKGQGRKKNIVRLPGARPTREVVDPNNPERRIEVEFNTRDDILGAMLADGVVNRIQFDAGRRLQAVYHLTEVAPRPNRWSAPVDGGNNDYVGSKKEREVAAIELANIKCIMHWWDYNLLRRVLG